MNSRDSHFPEVADVEFMAKDGNGISTGLVISVRLQNSTSRAWAGHVMISIREVGWDNRQPEAPLALAESGPMLIPAGEAGQIVVPLEVGTPFYWTESTPYRYAARLTLADGEQEQSRDLVFTLTGPDAGLRVTVQNQSVPLVQKGAARVRSLPAIFGIGDSTGFSNGVNQQGWCDALPSFFDLSRCGVFNRCRPGRSTRSYRREGLWTRVRQEMGPGDVILIQFGHNDADLVDQYRFRGVLPGTGDEKREVSLPNGSVETVYTFGHYLRLFCDETREAGARPVLLSPTPKNEWSDGKLRPSDQTYGLWSREVATELGVPFIDATSLIAEKYRELGALAVQALFCHPEDNVHTSPQGAMLNAQCIALALCGCQEMASTHAAIQIQPKAGARHPDAR